MTLSEFYDAERRQQRFDDNSNNKTETLTLILDIVRKINSSLKLEEVLKAVLFNALKLTNTSRGFIVLKNSKNKLEFSLGFNILGEELFESSFMVSDLVIEDVFANGESMVIAGARNAEESKYLKNCTVFHIQTIFCSPLIVDGEKIGVIYVDRQEQQQNINIDIAFTFEILAEYAAIAIKNAKVHEKLEREHRKTLNAEKLKDDFLTLISHEIRNPLNFIMTHAQLLKDASKEILEEEYLESFDIINSGGLRLLRSIDLILHISEINSCSYAVRIEELDVIKDIISPIINEYENQAHYKKNKLILNNQLKEDHKIMSDQHSVFLMFTHLIDNAVKFTEDGEVRINVFNEPEKDRLTVEVNDTGIGISSEYLPNIFDQFTQEETGYTRHYDGMGLGLALVKSYCNLNEFEVSVKSKKRIGSKFKVVFNQ